MLSALSTLYFRHHMTEKYRPISCEFHDLLEALATLRGTASLVFRVPGNGTQRRRAGITDIYSREGAEYLVTDAGETVRLDDVVSVDDAKLADFQQ